MKEDSVNSTIMFGIAFFGKEVIVETDRISRDKNEDENRKTLIQ